MKMMKNVALVFGASALVGAVLGHAGTASASGYERFPGIKCVPSPAQSSGGTAYIGSAALSNVGNGPLYAFCPIDDTPDSDHGRANAITIGTIGGSTGGRRVAAAAFITDYYDYYIRVGAFADNNYGANFVSVAPDLSIWTSSWGGNFASVEVVLDPQTEVTGIYFGTN